MCRAERLTPSLRGTLQLLDCRRLAVAKNHIDGVNFLSSTLLCLALRRTLLLSSAPCFRALQKLAQLSRTLRLRMHPQPLPGARYGRLCIHVDSSRRLIFRRADERSERRMSLRLRRGGWRCTRR